MMNAVVFRAGSIDFTPALIVAGISVLQWIVFATISALSSSRFPKAGMRSSDRNLVISSIILAAAWLVQVDIGAMAMRPKSVASAGLVQTRQGSCASIDQGMSVDDVKTKMGPPDETRAEEEIRGPGASILIYRGSRCVVHVFDGRVDFVQ